MVSPTSGNLEPSQRQRCFYALRYCDRFMGNDRNLNTKGPLRCGPSSGPQCKTCEKTQRKSTPYNDEGVPVRLGLTDRDRYYCGRFLGTDIIPYSDGRCGVHNGPSCPSCARLDIQNINNGRPTTNKMNLATNDEGAAVRERNDKFYCGRYLQVVDSIYHYYDNDFCFHGYTQCGSCLRYQLLSKLFDGVLENVDKAPWMRSKLMVIGRGRSGKTATVRSLLKEPFKSDLDSTIGASLTQTQMRVEGNELVKIEGAVDHTATIAAKFMAKEIAPMLTSADLIEQSKLNGEEIQNIIHVQESEDASEDVEVVEAQVEAQVERRSSGGPLAMEDVARKFDNELLMTEAGNSISFTIWDYGGQHVFYTLHHLFLTRYGVYLLIFNMKNILKVSNSPASEYHLNPDVQDIVFWLHSVTMHAPSAPLLLVGTFGDVVASKKEKRRVNKVILHILSKMCPRSEEQVIKNNPLNILFFPIDNRTGRGSQELSKMVEVTTREQSYVNLQVPIRWLRCLDAMLSSEAPWISLSNVKDIASEYEVHASTEIAEMLQFYNELGVLGYMTATDALRNVVITNPQWLINSLSKVIRDDKLHRFNSQEIANVGLEEDVESLFTHAIASRDLLEYLWEKDEVNFLLDLMKRTLLLSDWKFDELEERYFIPSLLASSEDIIGKFSDEVDAYSFLFDVLNGFLPMGVYERVVCLAIAHSATTAPNAKPVLGKSKCIVWIGDSRLTVMKRDTSILCGMNKKPAKVKSVLSLVTAMLKKVNEDAMNGGLKWQISVKNEESMASFMTLQEAEKRNMEPWAAAYTDDQKQKDNLTNLNLEDFMDSLN